QNVRDSGGAAFFPGTEAASSVLEGESGSMSTYSVTRTIYKMMTGLLGTNRRPDSRLGGNSADMTAGAKKSGGAKMGAEEKPIEANQEILAPQAKEDGMGGAPKYVYKFGAGKADGSADMKNLLGGKGANLAEMANLGLPVPPGFTITTEVCIAYYANGRKLPEGLHADVQDAVTQIGTAVGAGLGDA